uniref:Uncharacterized protein n=1 Tax=Anguilla anguilla TaxID=7936 RepID=A0A0E9R4W7_ANGAN
MYRTAARHPGWFSSVNRGLINQSAVGQPIELQCGMTNQLG